MRIKRIITSIIASAICGTIISVPSVSAVTDPNGDGVINIADAVEIGMYLYADHEPTNISVLDFDGNGIVSEMDYISVQLYVSDLWEG